MIPTAFEAVQSNEVYPPPTSSAPTDLLTAADKRYSFLQGKAWAYLENSGSRSRLVNFHVQRMGNRILRISVLFVLEHALKNPELAQNPGQFDVAGSIRKRGGTSSPLKN